MKYTVIIEKGPTSYGAYIPDLPGCVAAAETREEVVSLIQEAASFHVEDMVESGEAIPMPTSAAIEVDVAIPGVTGEVAVETGR